jgi:hypothetical protein
VDAFADSHLLTLFNGFAGDYGSRADREGAIAALPASISEPTRAWLTRMCKMEGRLRVRLCARDGGCACARSFVRVTAVSALSRRCLHAARMPACCHSAVNMTDSPFEASILLAEGVPRPPTASWQLR